MYFYKFFETQILGDLFNVIPTAKREYITRNGDNVPYFKVKKSYFKVKTSYFKFYFSR